MKIQLKTLTIIFFILPLVSGCQAIFLDCKSKQTTKQRHLKRLLKTNKCTNCYLGDADLKGADLRGADLSVSYLVKAVLDDADLRGANLENAQFAWFDGNYGAGANGWIGPPTSCYVDLSASLKRVDLSGANLENANLEGVELQGANLQATNLSGTNLTHANLQGANLQGANLSYSRLGLANFQQANLSNATLPDLRNYNKSRMFKGAIMPDGSVYQEDPKQYN